ncbi:MAG: translation initiation factor IF-3 [Candidatus Pacebacteria bacterium]|nr:translation initiation factor IF-3 [Candidatus Paceibacterota bacterium]
MFNKYNNRPQPRETHKINERITALELRVIGAQGENLGVISKEEALRIAKENGLDLIEISPNAQPPVAKIMSFDKFRYEEDKRAKKAKITQKGNEMKQIQISVKAAKNDLEIKVKQLEKFMEAGHPISIVLTLKGREKANKDWAKMKMEEFLKMIGLEFRIVSPPKFGGYGINAIIAKK